MDNLKITATIRVNGNEHVLSDQNNRWFTLDLKNDRHELKAVIDPIIPFELVDFRIECDYAFMPGDKFFSAGYQSWTTADEFTRGDIQRGAMAGFSKKLVHLSGISADDEIFGAYPRKRGLFHSITYTYIRSGDKLDLYGSMSEREGFTIIEADMNKGRLVFRRDTKGVFLVDKPYTALDIGIFFRQWIKRHTVIQKRDIDIVTIKSQSDPHLAGTLFLTLIGVMGDIDESLFQRQRHRHRLFQSGFVFLQLFFQESQDIVQMFIIGLEFPDDLLFAFRHLISFIFKRRGRHDLFVHSLILLLF